MDIAHYTISPISVDISTLEWALILTLWPVLVIEPLTKKTSSWECGCSTTAHGSARTTPGSLNHHSDKDSATTTTCWVLDGPKSWTRELWALTAACTSTALTTMAVSAIISRTTRQHSTRPASMASGKANTISMEQMLLNMRPMPQSTMQVSTSRILRASAEPRNSGSTLRLNVVTILRRLEM